MAHTASRQVITAVATRKQITQLCRRLAHDRTGHLLSGTEEKAVLPTLRASTESETAASQPRAAAAPKPWAIPCALAHSPIIREQDTNGKFVRCPSEVVR